MYSFSGAVIETESGKGGGLKREQEPKKYKRSEEEIEFLRILGISSDED